MICILLWKLIMKINYYNNSCKSDDHGTNCAKEALALLLGNEYINGEKIIFFIYGDAMMIKIAIAVFAFYCTPSSLHAQVVYKQNFILVFSKQPVIKDCETAYSFLSCKNDICAAFNAAKANLAKAYEELTARQIAANNAAMPSSISTMTAEDGKKLSEKLKKMTKEEKQQWAMQNAHNFMPSAAAYVNKDMDNQQVTDAVNNVVEQQAKDIKILNTASDVNLQFIAIEKKYEPKKKDALKSFQTITHTTYDPSSSMVYVLGEASDVEAALFDKAIEEYKKSVIPVYNSEMKEKINCVLQSEHSIDSTYTFLEGKIAATQYGDDAQEPVNKMHLIAGHLGVLQKVRITMGVFEQILSDYADKYAALMKIMPVKEVRHNEKEE
jgi:hypothetical protein